MSFQLRRVLKTGFGYRLRRLIPTIAVLALVMLLCGPSRPGPRRGDISHAPTEVCFSPNSGSTDAIIRELDRARSEILVQAYSFTSAPIAKALLKATSAA